MLMESWLIAAATASLGLSSPALPEGGTSMVSIRPVISVLAAQGGSAWFFPNQQDKLYHAMGCALVSSVTTEITGNPWVGLASGVGVGIIKELLDIRFQGDPDYRDLGADLLGAGIGTLVYIRF